MWHKVMLACRVMNHVEQQSFNFLEVSIACSRHVSCAIFSGVKKYLPSAMCFALLQCNTLFAVQLLPAYVLDCFDATHCLLCSQQQRRQVLHREQTLLRALQGRPRCMAGSTRHMLWIWAQTEDQIHFRKHN